MKTAIHCDLSDLAFRRETEPQPYFSPPSSGMTTSITLASLKQIPLSYATGSIGCHPSDSLPRKIEAIANAGFTAVELSFFDLRVYASQQFNSQIAEEDYRELCAAAREIKNHCRAAKLDIIMLQPLSNFEGWPKGSRERAVAFSRATGWIEIMQACGTDMLQVCGTFATLSFFFPFPGTNRTRPQKHDNP
jgi:sugar phosphate isomerase/epimerase